MQRDELYEKARMVATGEKTDFVPVVLQAYSNVLKDHSRLNEREYHQDFRSQLDSKIAFSRRFPEALNIAVAWPEGGKGGFVGAIPTAFGGEMEWREDSPPVVGKHPIENLEDVDRLREEEMPDPRKKGCSTDFLESLQYYYDWYPKDLRESWPCIDGFLCPFGAVESAALALGYDTFMIWMREHPDALKRWLKLATDWHLEYCEAIEEIVGECRVLFIPDHTPQFVGPDQFEEFILPYLNRSFEKYPDALRIWHNEGSVNRIIEEIDKIKAEVWHFGPEDDPEMCKEETHFCLMGNIHPPWFRNVPPKEVMKRAKKIMEKVGPEGKLWLSTGGGLAPGTSFRNIEALIKASKKYA